jgi:hypothetical protein
MLLSKFCLTHQCTNLSTFLCWITTDQATSFRFTPWLSYAFFIFTECVMSWAIEESISYPRYGQETCLSRVYSGTETHPTFYPTVTALSLGIKLSGREVRHSLHLIVSGYDFMELSLYTFGPRDPSADHMAPSIRKSWQSFRRQAAVVRSV